MAHWLQLLAGSLLCGAGVVWGIVLPRRAAFGLVLIAGLGLVAALAAAADIRRGYGTPEALGAAAFFLVAGMAIGYAVSAASLPALALGSRSCTRSEALGSGSQALVLLACTDPERYDPRAVATQGADLARSGAVSIPLAATPFVYLAEKARYRALGGHSPGSALAEVLREEVSRALKSRGVHADVRLAWLYSRPTLAEIVRSLAAAGTREVGIVVLGDEDSDAVDRAKTDLDSACPSNPTLELAFGPSLWADRAMPERLLERVREAIGEDSLDGLGVVLVCPGRPEAPGHGHPAALAEETYFNQRVRMLLAGAGMDERLIRIAWLEWQVPDVTETVRHLAALGCARILVVPSTIVLPTVSTALDVHHAVDLARLPESVHVSVVTHWGDDATLVDAIAGSAVEALGTIRRPTGP